MDQQRLEQFIRESFRIEGIHRQPSSAEMEAHERFLALPVISVADLQQFVSIIQPGAQLRDRPGLDVRVGDYVAPRGGPEVRTDLEDLLIILPMSMNPYKEHRRYERLHPFTDGNGRSGRALWLWQHHKRGTYMGLGFLHQWYYESLA